MLLPTIQQYRLPNGLEVMLAPRLGPELVSTNIWYRAGSANDPKNKTGLAHLFEHMMFQGSQNIAKGQHFQLVQQAGGRLNASTSIDHTNYYQKVPSEYLEMVLMLEADRMGYFLPALDREKLQNQIDVVSNERMEHYDNQPYGLAHERMLSLCYAPSHPYAFPVIGKLEHIKGFTQDDVAQFFRQHYSPSNAALVIAGDYEEKNARELVEKYFGSLPDTSHPGSGAHESRKADVLFSQYDEYEDDVTLDKIILAYHTCEAYHPDYIPLHMLSELLTGSKNGYLTKALVLEEQTAQSVSSVQYSGKHGGIFFISALAREGTSLSSLKERILELLDGIPSQIESRHIERTRNSILSNYYTQLEDLSIFADYINHYKYYLGVPDGINIETAQMNAATPESLTHVSQRYLREGYNELRILSKSKQGQS